MCVCMWICDKQNACLSFLSCKSEKIVVFYLCYKGYLSLFLYHCWKRLYFKFVLFQSKHVDCTGMMQDLPLHCPVCAGRTCRQVLKSLINYVQGSYLKVHRSLLMPLFCAQVSMLYLHENNQQILAHN